MKALEGLTRRVTGIGLIVLAAMPSPRTLVNASSELAHAPTLRPGRNWTSLRPRPVLRSGRCA